MSMAWVGIASGEITWVYAISKNQLVNQTLPPRLAELILIVCFGLGKNKITLGRFIIKKYTSSIQIIQK